MKLLCDKKIVPHHPCKISLNIIISILNYSLSFWYFMHPRSQCRYSCNVLLCRKVQTTENKKNGPNFLKTSVTQVEAASHVKASIIYEENWISWVKIKCRFRCPHEFALPHIAVWGLKFPSSLRLPHMETDKQVDATSQEHR